MTRKNNNILSDGNYRSIFLSHVWSSAGTVVGNVAIPLVAVSVLKASPFELSVISIARYLPNLVLSFYMGILVDRLPLKKTAISMDYCRAGVLIIVPIAWITGNLNFTLLVLVSAILGSIRIPFELSLSSIIPILIPEEKRKSANANFETISNISNIAGPGLGGVFVGLIGAPLALLFHAVSSILSAFSLKNLDEPIRDFEINDSSEDKKFELKKIFSGFSEFFRYPVLVALIGAGAISNMALLSFQSVYYAYALENWNFTEAVAASLIAAIAVGSISGNRAVSYWSKFMVSQKILVTTYILIFVSSLLLITIENLEYTVKVLFLFGIFLVWGFSFGVFNVLGVTYRQKVIPSAVMGRVLGAARTMLFGAFPLGALLGGIFSNLYGFIGVVSVNIFLNFLSLVILIYGMKRPEAHVLEDL